MTLLQLEVLQCDQYRLEHIRDSIVIKDNPRRYRIRQESAQLALKENVNNTREVRTADEPSRHTSLTLGKALQSLSLSLASSFPKQGAR